MTKPIPSRSNPRRGFSLTELAIVLGVGGTIVAGVWLFAGSIMDSSKRTALQSQITTVVTNLRGYVSSQSAMPAEAMAALMADLVTAKVIPNYMVRTSSCGAGITTCADTPWGSLYSLAPSTSIITDPNGTFQVCGSDITGACSTAGTQYFAITVEGLSSGNCFALATGTTGASAPVGLINVLINGTNILGLGAGHYLPVLTSDANAYCTNPKSGNAITYIFRLSAPS